MYLQAEGQRATFEAVLWGQKSNLNLINLSIGKKYLGPGKVIPHAQSAQSRTKKLCRINVLISSINQDETNKQEIKGEFINLKKLKRHFNHSSLSQL